jgi:methionyl-tRNA synthetase
MKKVLVSSPPPTANGDLHVGHLSGPFLRADILTRYLKMRDVEAYCLCGTDEHQSYVAYRAEQLGLTPTETVDRFSEAIRKTMDAARIDVDVYLRPSQSTGHVRLTQGIFASLYANGTFITKEEPALYCENCDQYLFEVYVCGECPHCGNGTCGNACEACGKPNDCTDLIDPICNRCRTRPVTRSASRLYFPLSAYEQQLRAYYESVEMNSHLRTLCEQMLEDGLPDIPMSYPSNWGIRVPISGFGDQRINVWFEVGAGLLAATHVLSKKLGMSGGWSQLWHANDVDVVTFCGFDNGFYYAMLIPAIFLAYDSQIKLVKTFLINEFYRLDGLKFSTSRNHAIWGRQLLNRASADTVRFYLALTGPETEQTNFTMEEFEETVQRELIDGCQSWLHDLGNALATEYQGVAPAPKLWTNEQHQFYERLEGFIAEAAAAYSPNTFSPRRAASVLLELLHAAQRFGNARRRQRKHAGFQQTTVALELAAAKTLALLAAPIMPDFSTYLWRDLGNETPIFQGSWEERPRWVRRGKRIDYLDRQYFPMVKRPPTLSATVASAKPSSLPTSLEPSSGPSFAEV